MHIFNNAHFDFLRWRWHAIALSWVIIIAGIVVTVTKGIPRGVEFAGGTVVIEKFDQNVSVDQVRAVLDRNYPGGGQNAVVQATGDPAQHMVMIRVPEVGAESGAALSTTAQKVEAALGQGNLGGMHREGAEIVSATVGRELETKGLLATLGTLKAEKKTLIVDSSENENLKLSIRNMPENQFLPPEGVNVYDLLRHDHLVVSKQAARALEARCKGVKS